MGPQRINIPQQLYRYLHPSLFLLKPPHHRLGIIPPVAGVCAPVTGVGALLGTLLLLCAIWALTRWPAHRALFRESSPAKTPAAMMRARRRALSPGAVGWAPRTPRRSSMADWGSRMVPPPMVPTSIEGMETEIWRLPFTLEGG
jgi:hypothetical protein